MFALFWSQNFNTTAWKTHGSPFYNRKSSFDLTFHKGARKICTEFGRCVFSSVPSVFKLSISFCTYFRFYTFQCGEQPILMLMHRCFCLIKTNLLQNFVVLMSNFIRCDLARLSTFLCWRILFVDVVIFAASFHSIGCSIDWWIDERVSQSKWWAAAQFIHSFIQDFYRIRHIIIGPTGGQCFSFCSATAREEEVHSHQFALPLFLLLGCSFVRNRNAKWKGFDLILNYFALSLSMQSFHF